MQYSSTVYLAIQVNGPSSTVITPGTNSSYWVATGVNGTAPANYISLTALSGTATVAYNASVFAAAASPTVAPTPVTGYSYDPTSGNVTVAAAGTYVYDFDILVNEAGSLGLTVNGSLNPNTAFGRATGTSQIVGHGLITLPANAVVNLINSNSSTTLTFSTSPTQDVVASFTLVALAAGTPGAPGAAATVSVGTTTTGAAGSSASVSNSGTSSAATFNFTIPQGVAGAAGAAGVVQSIAVGTVGNTASAGLGTLTVGGTAANPTISINFPVSSGGGTPTIPAWTSGTAYTAGQLVTNNNGVYYCLADNTASSSNEPGTSGGATYWGGISIGTGANPVGIPYVVGQHEFDSTYLYFNLAAAGGVAGSQAAIGNGTTTIAPTACTPSYTIWNASEYTSLSFQLYTAVPSSSATGSSGWSTGTAIGGACTITAAGANGASTISGSGTSCTVMASSQVPAGTMMTLELSSTTTPALQTGVYYVFYSAFTCQ